MKYLIEEDNCPSNVFMFGGTLCVPFVLWIVYWNAVGIEFFGTPYLIEGIGFELDLYEVATVISGLIGFFVLISIVALAIERYTVYNISSLILAVASGLGMCVWCLTCTSLVDEYVSVGVVCTVFALAMVSSFINVFSNKTVKAAVKTFRNEKAREKAIACGSKTIQKLYEKNKLFE